MNGKLPPGPAWLTGAEMLAEGSAAKWNLGSSLVQGSPLVHTGAESVGRGLGPHQRLQGLPGQPHTCAQQFSSPTRIKAHEAGRPHEAGRALPFDQRAAPKTLPTPPWLCGAAGCHRRRRSQRENGVHHCDSDSASTVSVSRHPRPFTPKSDS